jgi:tetratricopeptide (TPR) repeat protein
MTKNVAIYQADVKLTNHWMIVGYEKDLPFIKAEEPTQVAINFPFELSADRFPYVGGLDIKGNPVYIKRVGDVTDYLKIKKLFKNEKYDLCLELIDEVVQSYPNSLFNAELLYYKIKVYSKMKDFDNVIELSKLYLREYSSDENVPEILALLAQSYSSIGLNIDADYFFDRLFDEHEESEFAKLGYIYRGEMLEASGASSKAVTFYKKALTQTSDIEIAAQAAYKLAHYYLASSDKNKAANYIMKIIKAKPEFFMNDIQTSFDMMYLFADNGDYITAASIAKAIIDQTDKDYDEYERLLKDRGIWLSKSPDKKKALEALNEYIKKYKYGTYEEEVAIAKDELFFDVNDANFSLKLQKYDNLMQEYKDNSIGKRAIYEKAKLLYENKMYSDVLDFENTLMDLDQATYEDIPKIIKDSAIGVMKLSLKNRECQEVLNISNDYNITLSNDWDDGVYECSMKGGDYVLSKKIAARNLKSKNIELRKKWLYRYIKVDFATGSYTDVIEASKDLIALIEGEKSSKYNDVYRILFDTYQRLEMKDKLLSAIIKIQKLFGLDYKDIERYVSVMSMGSDKKDDNIVIKYGEEVVKIQNSSSSYAQSPYVEFTLYQSYINIQDYEKALKIIRLLDNVELDKSDRARQKYLMGSVLSKLWRDEEAQVAYKESIKADPSSPWAELAKSMDGI